MEGEKGKRTDHQEEVGGWVWRTGSNNRNNRKRKDKKGSIKPKDVNKRDEKHVCLTTSVLWFPECKLQTRL